ncbi:MAG: phage holin family protein [Candidatus Gribaldobacteria bacterium]|nr:phage holin family protein [Candidatus Gribaldobacteria bacterium]
MRRFLASIAGACLGLIVTALLLSGFQVSGDFQQASKTLLIAGVTLGLINFFVKPIIKIVTLPINIITLGFFSLVINIAIIWLIDIVFTPEITIKGLLNLFLTSFIVSTINLLIVPPKDND